MALRQDSLAEQEKISLFNRNSSTALWSHTASDVSGFYEMSFSSDGEILAAVGTSTGTCCKGQVYLFDKDSSTPLWSYETKGWAVSVSVSGSGDYIAVGCSQYTGDSYERVYLFGRSSSTPLWSYNTG